MIKAWPEKWRTRLQMVLISAAVGGIELCYSAETAFVSPLLLQLGVPVYLMTMCWIASPVLGFFLVPILGSVSDTCTSRLGRRRPFILLYSVGVIIGLILVPYGKNIGELLGDVEDEKINGTLSNTSNINLDTGTAKDLAETSHAKGIFFTILGVMLLDFCADACQTPCRTLMIDLMSVEDQPQGLTTFTIVAGIGGAIGYTIGGVKWSKHVTLNPLNPEFTRHVHTVFGLVLIIFIIGCLLTIFSVKERVINKTDSAHKYTKYIKLWKAK